MLARYRPAEYILAMSDQAENMNKLTLVFGTFPLLVPTFKTIAEMLDRVRDGSVAPGLVEKGDIVVAYMETRQKGEL